MDEFPSFLARAGAMSSLTFTSATNPDSVSPPSKKVKANSTRKKVILVEDLPNIFTSDSTRINFRNALHTFVASNRPSTIVIPLIIIISEALSRESNENEFAFGAVANAWQSNVTPRTVLPLEILKGGKCTEIKFNPVAVTILNKALNGILDRVSDTVRKPPKNQIDTIVHAANGDIRSAVNLLELLVRDGNALKHLVEPGAKAKKSKKKNTAKDGESESKLLAHLSARESSLFLFHALGKVLYSKRKPVLALLVLPM